jgi:hypothetical protein
MSLLGLAPFRRLAPAAPVIARILVGIVMAAHGGRCPRRRMIDQLPLGPLRPSGPAASSRSGRRRCTSRTGASRSEPSHVARRDPVSVRGAQHEQASGEHRTAEDEQPQVPVASRQDEARHEEEQREDRLGEDAGVGRGEQQVTHLGGQPRATASLSNPVRWADGAVEAQEAPAGCPGGAEQEATDGAHDR